MDDYWLSEHTARLLPARGTTAVLASIVFPPDEKVTARVIAGVEAQVRATQTGDFARKGYARVLGIHAEGPVRAAAAAI